MQKFQLILPDVVENPYRTVYFIEKAIKKIPELARSLGCDQVLSKGEFSRDMPRVIAQYADSTA